MQGYPGVASAFTLATRWATLLGCIRPESCWRIAEDAERMRTYAGRAVAIPDFAPYSPVSQVDLRIVAA